MKVYSSLRNILTFNFVLVATLPILVVGLIALHILTTSMEQEIADKNFLLAKSLAGEVERFLEESLRILVQIGDIVIEKELIRSDHINSYFDSVIKNYSFFEMLLILDHEGKVRHLAPYDEDFLLIDMSGQEFFRVTSERHEPYWSPTFISLQTGQPTLTLSVPLKNRVLVGYLNLATLNFITDKVKLGSHGYAWIADKDGTLIAHPNKTFVSQRVNVQNLLVVQQAMKGYEGMSEYRFEGVNKLGNTAIVPHTYWIVAVSQPIKEAYAPIKKIRSILGTGTWVAIILAIVIALFSLKKTLEPLFQLTEHAQKIADGDYHILSYQKHYREVDELAHDFNVMVEAVETREKALQESEERLCEERASLAQKVKERTAELQVVNAELTRAARMKDEFLANMSHELRTPLNTVLGMAEALQEEVYGPLNNRQLRSLRMIEDGGRHLLALINDILDLSKIEAGKMELEIGKVYVESVCRASLQFIKQAALKKRLKISSMFASNVTTIQVDERRLKQILVNLLNNAVKFTPEDGSIGLEVEGEPEHQVVRFTVWDTGIGIPHDKIEDLFQPFVQLDATFSRRYEGAGLGLSLVYRMVEMHGGSISVESEIGKSSRFIVSLPWKDSKDGEIGSLGDRKSTDKAPHLSTSPSSHLPISLSSQSATILIADDNEGTIQTLLTYLDAKGYQLTIARNGKEAIARTKEEHPDLILMDIQMPEINGLEAIRHIRTNERIQSIPIIAVTALAMPGDRERCLSAGANEYLSKPVSLQKLSEILERLVTNCGKKE
jgi:signal transduction histidine kinase/ActR/RegA family two-component response regulator